MTPWRHETLATLGGVAAGAAAGWWLARAADTSLDDILYWDDIPRRPGKPALDGEHVVGILPDTQHYAATHPQIYATQTGWLSGAVDYVLHLGDLVDDAASRGEWNRVSDAHGILDRSETPYGVCGGDHDILDDRDVVEYMTGPWHHYRRVFPLERLDGDGASVVASRGGSRNYAHLVDLGDRRLLVLFLSWPTGDGYPLAWAHRVLEAYADTPTVLVTHSYLRADGSWSGHGEALAVLPATHEQVVLAVGGHHLTRGRPFVVHRNRVCQGLLVNAQNVPPSGGAGWLCTLSLDGDRARLETYSPHHEAVPRRTVAYSRDLRMG
jgi:hypothetical protein